MRFPNSMGSLRQIRTDQAAALLQRRIQMARTAGDQKGLEDLRGGELSLQVVWRSRRAGTESQSAAFVLCGRSGQTEYKRGLAAFMIRKNPNGPRS
jgi:hypothetical protein